MKGEIQPLVTNGPVDFEKYRVQDFRQIADHFRGIYGLYLALMKRI